MGRPTKIEPNPEHPASQRRHRRLRAGLDPRPLRSRPLADDHRPRRDRGRGASFVAAMQGALTAQRAPPGAPASASSPRPSPRRRWRRRSRRFSPRSRGEVDPVGSAVRATTSAPAPGRRSAATSKRATTSIRPTSSLSLDADFLEQEPARLRYARDFSVAPPPRRRSRRSNRLYVVESTPSNTGAMADHRLPCAPRRRRRSRARSPRASASPACGRRRRRTAASTWSPRSPRISRRIAAPSLVVAGEYQPAAVHALAHADERRARQRRHDRRISATGRDRADRSARRAARAGRRDERRQGRHAGHPRRPTRSSPRRRISSSRRRWPR